MKITYPLALVGILVVAIAVAAVATSRKEAPVVRTVQVNVTDDTTSSVAVKTGDDDDALRTALDDLSVRDRKWGDAADLAGRTARINLTTIVKDMQDQLRDNESAELPGCLETAKPYWLEAQRETIKGYLEFMGRNEFASADHFRNAERADRNYRMVLDACRLGTQAAAIRG